MADTTTTNFALVKPEVGASEDTWGTKINTNLDSLDTLLAARATLTGVQTLTNKTLGNALFTGPEERINIVASAATGTINLDVITSSVWHYTSNASANHTVNVRGNSGTTLNSLLSVGDSITVVWMFATGSTGYVPSTFQIDGSTATVRTSPRSDHRTCSAPHPTTSPSSSATQNSWTAS